MWTQFCDLALAGGPRHRDTLLEPAAGNEVQAAPARYSQVVAELERGLRLVTGLDTVRSSAPGWVGIRCDSEWMARWLLSAVAVENISVRREGTDLFLPAAPSFRLDQEIKSVVTVVAKTHHYWLEHRAD
jgi:sirohydrochlorin cobaltochelatase